MPTRAETSLPDPCPFLTPVTADHLWMYPVGAYCSCPPGGVRIPSAATVDSVCTTQAHRECPGYRSAMSGLPEAAG